MKKQEIDSFGILERVKARTPVIHHLTNWVTIYDCANVVKTLGASPVMAHAKEEAAEMAQIAGALVLNIGTLTVELVDAMLAAAKSANKKGIPVVLDACGAGATSLRDKKCAELLSGARIDILKGNASEIARIAGMDVHTKGVDAAEITGDRRAMVRTLAVTRRCTVVMTGAEDMISDGSHEYRVRNGHPMMAAIVGTGCMASSVIATFAAVEKDYALASAAGLACFGIAAERAAKKAVGTGSFKEKLFDELYTLDRQAVERMQKIAQ